MYISISFIIVIEVVVVDIAALNQTQLLWLFVDILPNPLSSSVGLPLSFIS